jgi:heat shock protein HslJ
MGDEGRNTDMTTMRTLLIGLWAVVLLTATTACGDQSATDGAGSGDSLDGAWVLTSGDVDGTALDLTVDRPVTLTLDGDKVTGSSACNLYFADLTVDGDTVTFGTIGGTEMACQDDVMNLEGRYLAALARITQAARAGETLTLTGDGVRLEFGSAPVEEPAALVGTTWTLDSLIEGDTASSVVSRPATLLLAENGTVTGSTGCRSFRGRWTAQGDDLVIGPLATPKIACRGAAGPQDTHVLAVLDGTVRAAVAGRTLTVSGARGLGLVFRAS